MARPHTALFAAITKSSSFEEQQKQSLKDCRKKPVFNVECNYCGAFVPEQGTVYYKNIEMVACGSCQDRNDYEAELNHDAFLEMQAENS